jgi:peptide chain release factor
MLLHLTAGRGPAECELAVGRFLAVLSREFDIEVLASESGRFSGCLKSALVRTDKDDLSLNGAVQWICRSPFRPLHKRKNWFIGVNRIDEPNDCGYEANNGGGVIFQTFQKSGKNESVDRAAMRLSNEADGVIFQTFRASGKGGQHVNKTESAVRAIQIATGLAAVASDERSQYQNKKTAVERLKELLRQRDDDAELCEKNALFFNHNNLSRGNPVRIYEGIGFKRIDKGEPL